jgi:hypothetical protein
MVTDDDFDNDLDTPTEADLDACYGSKYLGASDLGDRKVKSRIGKVRKETMQQQGKPERPKFVLYFTTLDKGVVLNVTNKATIVAALGKNPADWIGAEIGLFTIDTQFGGKPTKGLRLKVLSGPKPVAKAVVTPPPKPKPAAAEPSPWEDSEDPGFQGSESEFGEAAK